MFLSSLFLHNFRSFKKRQFSFSSQTTLIIGPNAAGKTNVLEAIYLLSTGKSFRASKEVEMISYDKVMARVGGKLEKSDSLEITLTQGEVQGKKTRKKLYKINGVGKRWRDFSGYLKCVLFRPEDIDLVLGPPSIRRNYLDAVLEQVDWQYRACNLAYQKGLRQRNKLLDRIREGTGSKSQLTFWNRLLIKNGQLITQKREELIGFFNLQLKNLEVFYDRSTITEKRLAKYAQAEMAVGSTLVGPHKDNLKFKMQNAKLKRDRDLRIFGSRGEQRMAVLRLKLAELKFIKQRTNQQPILLLDDIFSELDKRHRKLVLQIIDSCQTIITTAEPSFVKPLNNYETEYL